MLAELSGTPSSRRIHYAEVGKKVPTRHSLSQRNIEDMLGEVSDPAGNQKEAAHLERAYPQLKFLTLCNCRSPPSLSSPKIQSATAGSTKATQLPQSHSSK